MTVRAADIMRRHIYHVEPTTTVAAAAQQVVLAGIESLLVFEDDRPIGIVTERDLLSAVLPNVNDIMTADGVARFTDLIGTAPDRFDAPVSEVMTGRVATTNATAPLLTALGTMLSRRLRRLPVTDPETQEYVGVLTQRDVLAAVFFSAVPNTSLLRGPAARGNGPELDPTTPEVPAHPHRTLR